MKDRKFVAVYKHQLTGAQIEKTVLASDILEAAGQFDGIIYPKHECISISLVRMKEKKTSEKASAIFHDIMKASVMAKPKIKKSIKAKNNVKKG